jgi:signal transduction histidine kinase
MDLRMNGHLHELRESSDFLNVLLENISSAIFIVDPDLSVHNYNYAFAELFRKTEDRILGQLTGNAVGCQYTDSGRTDCGTSQNCQTCELRNSLLNSLLQNLPVNKGILNRAFLIDGKMVDKCLSYSSKLIWVQEKKRVLVIVDDITELQQQRRDLEAQNSKLIDLNLQKNKFLGIATHDLRNPIGSIQTISEILIDSYAEMDKAELESMLRIIGDLSHFSLNLIHDLLDISKIETGRLELKLGSHNYYDFLNNRLRIYKAYAKANRMNLDMLVAENIGDITFDDNKIEQVMNNLVSNAVKYSLQDASITISASREDNFVITSIQDTGQGIQSDELPLIFNEFQVTRTRATNGEQSTGLGLAIVKKIVEEHGGKVWAESQPDKGSTFYFTLPITNHLYRS